MKKFNWMTALLCTVILTGVSFAQTNSQKFNKALEQAVINAQKRTCAYCGKEICSQGQHCAAKGYTSLCRATKTQVQPLSNCAPSHCSVCGEQLTIDERYHGVKHVCKTQPKDTAAHCAFCGKEILGQGQHCQARGSVALCSPSKQELTAPAANSASSVCPICGEQLTIDERYHGVKHVCRNIADATYCILCGEPILTQSQHCAVLNYAGTCTVKCPECGENLRDANNLHSDGKHYCKFKQVITPAQPKK